LAPGRGFACLGAMASSSSGGRGLSFSIGGLSPRGEGPSPNESDVLRILVVADCSGRGSRGVLEPLAGRRAQPIDVERLEPVMRGWKARVQTPSFDPAGAPFWLEPRSLDDFHPDHLLANAAPLAELSSLRASLATDPAAAARLTARLAAGPAADAIDVAAGVPGPRAVSSSDASGVDARRAGESGADMLSRLLGGARAPAEPPRSEAPPATGKVDVDRFIRAIVANAGGAVSSVPRPSAEATAVLAAAAQAELARRLRALLAAPALRALEATWRGVDGLCRHNPDEESVRVSVFDASFDELLASPGAVSALLSASASHVLLLDHLFTPAPDGLRALAAVLDICRDRDVSVLAGAHPHLAGCAHFNEVSHPEEDAVVLPDEAREAWDLVLAARARGARLGLALPRFLLRQPYGASGEPIESFAFEEILDASDHEAFTWGNGAYLLARALGIQRAAERGVHPDGSIDVRDLPVVYLEGDARGNDGESRIKPNAEAWLSERSLGRLRAAGFSVLLGMRDTDRVRVYP
jgi:EvpB/VC_A0108, tail sheath N-terminal domain/Type VI secretion system, VipA, VC_A0107 or Hcp2